MHTRSRWIIIDFASLRVDKNLTKISTLFFMWFRTGADDILHRDVDDKWVLCRSYIMIWLSFELPAYLRSNSVFIIDWKQKPAKFEGHNFHWLNIFCFQQIQFHVDQNRTSSPIMKWKFPGLRNLFELIWFEPTGKIGLPENSISDAFMPIANEIEYQKWFSMHSAIKMKCMKNNLIIYFRFFFCCRCIRFENMI